MLDKLTHSVYIKFSHEGEAPPNRRDHEWLFYFGENGKEEKIDCSD